MQLDRLLFDKAVLPINHVGCLAVFANSTGNDPEAKRQLTTPCLIRTTPNKLMCLQATVTFRAPGVELKVVNVRKNAVLVIRDHALFEFLDIVGRRAFFFQGVRHGFHVAFGRKKNISRSGFRVPKKVE